MIHSQSSSEINKLNQKHIHKSFSNNSVSQFSFFTCGFDLTV